MSDWQIIEGDCLDVMAEMEPSSVEAIVTDPPYGLEFMGKSWDKLDGDLPQESVWKGRRGKGGSAVKDDQRTPASRSAVAFGAKRSGFKRCTICGKRQFSGSPCKCDDPKWVIEYPAGPPSAMVRMQRWHARWAEAALRVLKPGGYLLAFGGTRTFHRLTCAIEDAGFEIRDCLMWLYGSGFPKSLDVSKAIDKAAGAEREVVGSKAGQPGYSAAPNDTEQHDRAAFGEFTNAESECEITAPATEAARQWEGWGTALKPAWEPIIMARKPLSGTVAANVREHGTGAINVDGCRIGCGDKAAFPAGVVSKTESNYGGGRGLYDGRPRPADGNPSGRWPANVCLDEHAAAMLDEQSGELITNPGTRRNDGGGGMWNIDGPKGYQCSSGDSGGASRFFYYAKASRAEREAGLERLAARSRTDVTGRTEESAGQNNPRAGIRAGGKIRNTHPTVKPVELMRWLVRLVTPPGGTVLDPFAGSGSTGVAAAKEGVGFVGVELSPEYCEIARARIEDANRQGRLF